MESATSKTDDIATVNRPTIMDILGGIFRVAVRWNANSVGAIIKKQMVPIKYTQFFLNVRMIGKWNTKSVEPYITSEIEVTMPKAEKSSMDRLPALPRKRATSAAMTERMKSTIGDAKFANAILRQ